MFANLAVNYATTSGEVFKATVMFPLDGHS